MVKMWEGKEKVGHKTERERNRYILWIKELQGWNRRQRRPVVQKWVDLTHTAPVPAGCTGHDFGQAELKVPTIVALVPEQLLVYSWQPGGKECWVMSISYFPVPNYKSDWAKLHFWGGKNTDQTSPIGLQVRNNVKKKSTFYCPHSTKIPSNWTVFRTEQKRSTEKSKHKTNSAIHSRHSL